MRILMLSQTFPPENRTGAPLQAMYLSNALTELGVQVEVLVTHALGSDVPDYGFDGGNVHAIPYVSALGLSAISRFTTAAMKAAGKDLNDWDIIHGHALSPMVLGFALGRRRAAVPMLVKPSIGGDHGEGEVARIMRNPAASILRLAVQRIDRFAVLDELILADLKRLGVPEHRVEQIDNGIDIDRFFPARVGEKNGIRSEFGIKASTVVLFCGQLSKRKGVIELIAAWLNLGVSKTDALLVIVGNGPLVEEVQASAENSGGAIVYLGEHEHVERIIRMSDLLVLPSRFESFGNAIVEALASGIPVATTPCGISPRVVVPEKTGWIIKETTVEAIQDTLSQAMAARDQWSALGRDCRHMAEGFSFRKIATNYLKIYEAMRAS